VPRRCHKTEPVAGLCVAFEARYIGRPGQVAPSFRSATPTRRSALRPTDATCFELSSTRWKHGTTAGYLASPCSAGKRHASVRRATSSSSGSAASLHLPEHGAGLVGLGGANVRRSSRMPVYCAYERLLYLEVSEGLDHSPRRQRPVAIRLPVSNAGGRVSAAPVVDGARLYAGGP
jgi:hypothetical protein